MKFRGETNEAHPDLFNTPPLQPEALKEGQLSKEDVETFFREGFIIIKSFFKQEELEPAKETINKLVDELAEKLYKAGKVKISGLYRECGFSNRLSKLEQDFKGASILLHKIGQLPDSFGKIWSNERLLNVAEQLLGTSDISGHPVWNLRTKVPSVDAVTVPWHQDSSYLDSESYSVFQLTAWIPLVDATSENGCMQVIRRGHRKGKVARHTGCWKDTWYLMLDEDEIENTLGCNVKEDVVTCEVPYGGLLLFSNVLPHRRLAIEITTDNTSDHIRWSLDMRWQNSDKPNGFYGLKDGLKMRSSSDESFKVNWEEFNAVNRHAKQDEDCNKMEVDDFDITIPGPWMKNWEIVNTNKHTRALEQSGEALEWNPNLLLVG